VVGGILNNHLIANSPQSVSAKELFKAANIWQIYGQKLVDIFCVDHGVIMIIVGDFIARVRTL